MVCPRGRRDLDVLTSAIHLERDPAQLVDPHSGPPAGRRRCRRRSSGTGTGSLGTVTATRLPDVEPVYGTVIQLARLVWRVQGLKFTVTGVENLPAHRRRRRRDQPHQLLRLHVRRTARLQAAPAAARCGSWRRKRSSTTRSPARSCAACGTSRSTATAARRRSSRPAGQLKEGELVGVYPEATISRSFEIKEFKSGAARMAIAADVPIVPHIVWGAQRIWTKGHPKNDVAPQGADLGGGRRADRCRPCRRRS